MWYVEGKFPWGIERYEMLTREQSREIHGKMSRSVIDRCNENGDGLQAIMVKSGLLSNERKFLNNSNNY